MSIAEIEVIQAAAQKVQAAIDRLTTLVKDGALKEDIDAQKALIAQELLQLKEVVGLEPMPPVPPVA